MAQKTWGEVKVGDRLRGSDFVNNGYLEVVRLTPFESPRHLWVTMYKQGLRGDPEGRVVILVSADEPLEEREMVLLECPPDLQSTFRGPPSN